MLKEKIIALQRGNEVFLNQLELNFVASFTENFNGKNYVITETKQTKNGIPIVLVRKK